jgi:hypothetical protein
MRAEGQKSIAAQRQGLRRWRRDVIAAEPPKGRIIPTCCALHKEKR